MNRYNQDVRLVTPATAPGRDAYVITPAQAAQLMQANTDGPTMAHNEPQAQSLIDNVFTPQPLTKDAYSPNERGTGLLIRCIPFVFVYGILSFSITEALQYDLWVTGVFFCVPLLITVAYMSDRTDRYTPAGVELERVAAAERTEFVKGERQERILDKHLTHQQELRRMALEATIKMLERGDRHEKQ